MPHKILVVDDEFAIRMLLKNTFYDQDQFYLEEAENGEDAIEKAIGFNPDIIILDIMMPKIDGYLVCQKIKTHYALKKTYIIMLSAKHQPEDIKRAMEFGADEFMTKPFEPDNLRVHVIDVLNSIDNLKEIEHSILEHSGFIHYIKGRNFKKEKEEEEE